MSWASTDTVRTVQAGRSACRADMEEHGREWVANVVDSIRDAYDEVADSYVIGYMAEYEEHGRCAQ